MDIDGINDMLDHFDIRALPTSIGEFICWVLGDCVLRNGLMDMYREFEKRMLDRTFTEVDPEWSDLKKDAWFFEATHELQVAVLERIVAVFKQRSAEEDLENQQEGGGPHP